MGFQEAKMKMRLSVFSLLFVLLILFLLYKLFLTPGGKAGLPPESALKTIDKAKEISADSSFDMIMRGVNSFKQEKGELPSTLEELVPFYLRILPADPWGRPFRYNPQEGGSYTLASAGADGRFDTSDDLVKKE